MSQISCEPLGVGQPYEVKNDVGPIVPDQSTTSADVYSHRFGILGLQLSQVENSIDHSLAHCLRVAHMHKRPPRRRLLHVQGEEHSFCFLESSASCEHAVCRRQDALHDHRHEHVP